MRSHGVINHRGDRAQTLKGQDTAHGVSRIGQHHAHPLSDRNLILEKITEEKNPRNKLIPVYFRQIGVDHHDAPSAPSFAKKKQRIKNRHPHPAGCKHHIPHHCPYLPYSGTSASVPLCIRGKFHPSRKSNAEGYRREKFIRSIRPRAQRKSGIFRSLDAHRNQSGTALFGNQR